MNAPDDPTPERKPILVHLIVMTSPGRAWEIERVLGVRADG